MQYGRIDENGNIIIGLPNILKNNGKIITNLNKLPYAKLLSLGFFPVREDNNIPYDQGTHRKSYGEWRFDTDKQEIYRLEYLEEIPAEEIAARDEAQKTEIITQALPAWQQHYLFARGIAILYKYLRDSISEEDRQIMDEQQKLWEQMKSVRDR